MLGYIIHDGARGYADQLLSALAQRLTQDGMTLAGVVQNNIKATPNAPCDMELRCLRSSEVFRISHPLGADSQACRLDAHSLEMAAAFVQQGFADHRCDLLIINKFGKHEAEGRGFRQLIAQAITQGCPVLLSLSEKNRSAFMAFTQGFGDLLRPDMAAIQAWTKENVAMRYKA